MALCCSLDGDGRQDEEEDDGFMISVRNLNHGHSFATFFVFAAVFIYYNITGGGKYGD